MSPRPRSKTEADEMRAAFRAFIPLMIAGAHASVRCPCCGGEFQVEGKRWREPLMSVVKPSLEIEGRPCPYCFKPSLIPLDFYPKKMRALKAARRGKVC